MCMHAKNEEPNKIYIGVFASVELWFLHGGQHKRLECKVHIRTFAKITPKIAKLNLNNE